MKTLIEFQQAYDSANWYGRYRGLTAFEILNLAKSHGFELKFNPAQ